MDYVARPGHAEAKRLVDNYSKSRGMATSLKMFAQVFAALAVAAAVLSVTAAMIWPVAWFLWQTPPNRNVFLSILILYIVIAGVLGPTSLGYSLFSSSMERQIKPLLEAGDILELRATVAWQWRKERESNPRVGDDAQYDLQHRYNDMVAEWRREHL